MWQTTKKQQKQRKTIAAEKTGSWLAESDELEVESKRPGCGDGRIAAVGAPEGYRFWGRMTNSRCGDGSSYAVVGLKM